MLKHGVINMQTLINTSIALRKNLPAIWTEGRKLAVGFKHGDYFRVETNPNKKQIKFIRDPKGDFFVSKRTGKDGTILPLIEYKDEMLLSIFEVGMKIRIVVKDGVALISVNGNCENTVNRVSRFLGKIQRGEPLEFGSLFTGGGVLDRAIHEGFKAAGIDSYLKIAVESNEQYVEALLRNQSDLFKEDSILVNSLIEDLDIGKSFSLEVLIAGIPCTGSSPAGKSKLKIKNAEQHPQSGDCFFHTLNVIKATAPAVIILENVNAFENEMSFVVMQSVLTHWGYKITKTSLNGCGFGSLENRDRLGVVAVSDGLDDFSFDEFVFPLKKKEDSLNDFIVELSEDDEQWRSYDYLSAKEVRDELAGKGFRRSLYDGSEPSVVTIRRLYHKGGSCDPFLKHPKFDDNNLTRKFLPIEHASFKGIPHFIIDGLSATLSHEILGQSVCFPVFYSVGYGVGLYSLKNAGVLESFDICTNNEGGIYGEFSQVDTFEAVSVYRKHATKFLKAA
jgi:DNA (cytosine-5)-methyltransferase 1